MPFLRRYPGRIFVVTTFSCVGRAPRPARAERLPRRHRVALPLGRLGRRRACRRSGTRASACRSRCPSASCCRSTHWMWNRPGTRMIAAAPYDLHASAAGSFAGSQALAILRASGLSGSIEKSPLRRHHHPQVPVLGDDRDPGSREVLGRRRARRSAEDRRRPPARAPGRRASPASGDDEQRGEQREPRRGACLLDPAPPLESVARPLARSR